VKRSFLAVYNQERKKPSKGIPNSWRNAIKKYNWEERVKAWDAQQRVLDEEKFAAARDKAREARQTNILALTTLLGRVIVNEQKSAETKARILGGKDPDKQIAAIKEAGMDAKVLKDLATAASAIMKDSRIEFGEATDIQQLQGKGEDGAIEVSHINTLALKNLFQGIGQRETNDTRDENEA
jgi:hypothetical protein